MRHGHVVTCRVALVSQAFETIGVSCKFIDLANGENGEDRRENRTG